MPKPYSTALFQPLGPVLQPWAVDRLRSWAGSGEPAAQALVSAVGLRLELDRRDLERMPAQGPLILISRRPDAAVEPCALLLALRARRPDLLAFQAGWVEELEEGQALSLGPGDDGARSQRAEAHLRQGGAVLIFVDPRFMEGRLSHRLPRQQALRLTSLALGTGAHVQALRLEGGRRRPWLKLMGLDKPGFRRRLFAKAFRRARPRLRVSLGQALPARRLAEAGGALEAAELLAMRCWLTGRRGPKALRVPTWASRWRRSRQRPLASALPPALLEAELDRLPKGSLLAQAGDMECWLAAPGEIPSLLREIGRLRELCFREAGEGSGLPLDLDRFDQHYQQLFLWHRKERCVVGGYRFAPVDRVLASHGLEGLYTHSLLRFKPALLEQLGPALELGRSFVSPAFQRGYTPLLLLWKGIGAWIAANPQYRQLFGLVSMSADYQPLSRELVASFVKQHLFRGDLARLTRPRKPFRPAYAKGRHDELTWRFGSHLDDVNEWVSEVEPDGKGLPVLFRQYAKLGGVFVSFSVDPDFGDALDGLVCIDLLQAEPRILERTMGQQNAAQFLARHHAEAPC